LDVLKSYEFHLVAQTVQQLGKPSLQSLTFHISKKLAVAHKSGLLHRVQVLIMAYTCDFCGYRNNEVKAGGSVPDVGNEVYLIVACIKY